MKKLLFLGLGLVATGSASAALLGYEGFDYADGTSFVGETGGIGFTSNWLDLNGSQSNALVTNGVAAWNSVDTVVRAFTAQNSGEIWIKYVGVMSSDSYINLTNNNTFTSAGASVAIGSGGGGAEYVRAYAAGIDVQASNTGTSGVVVGSTVGTTATYYVKVVLGADQTSSVWYNPAANFDGTQAATGTFTSNITSADRIKVRLNFVSGDVGTLDQLIVGTTVADVIPEPSAALLGGLGALALLRRRRA